MRVAEKAVKIGGIGEEERDEERVDDRITGRLVDRVINISVSVVPSALLTAFGSAATAIIPFIQLVIISERNIISIQCNYAKNWLLERME